MTKDITVESLVDSKYNIKARISKGYNTKEVIDVLDSEHWESLKQTARLKGLPLWGDLYLTSKDNKKTPLMCLDIDSRFLWEKLIESLTPDLKSQILINPSTRGGHLIFKSSGIQKNKINKTGNLGFRGDYLFNKVTIFGDGKSFLGSLVEPSDLCECPNFLHPHKNIHIEPIILDTLIQKGNRNQTLYQWVNGTYLDFQSRNQLMKILKRDFCDPPLPEDEQITVHEPLSLRNSDPTKRNEKNEIVAARIKHDSRLIQTLFKGRFVYIPKTDQWYEYSLTHYVAITLKAVIHQTRTYILENAGNFQSKISEHNFYGLVSSLVQGVAFEATPSQEMLNVPPGKNFANGYFIYEMGELVPHSAGRFVTDVSSVRFNPNAKLSVIYQRFIAMAMGGNLTAVNLLRSMIFRSMIPDTSLHTGYVLTGPPGSGKSTLISLIKCIIGEKCQSFEAKDLQVGFNRHELIDVHVAVFNEVVSISESDEKFLKQLQGRDLISSQRKNVQGKFSNVFCGFCIIHSNEEPEVLFSKSSALTDRFLSLEFAHRVGEADNSLYNILESRISEIIVWGLSMEKGMLKLLTRAGEFNIRLTFDNHDVATFINENLMIEPQSELNVSLLYHSFSEFVAAENLNPKHNRAKFVKDVIHHFIHYFNYAVQQTRVVVGHRKLGGLKGLRFRLPNDAYLKYNFKRKELNNPPWENISIEDPGSEKIIVLEPESVESVDEVGLSEPLTMVVSHLIEGSAVVPLDFVATSDPLIEDKYLDTPPIFIGKEPYEHPKNKPISDEAYKEFMDDLLSKNLTIIPFNQGEELFNRAYSHAKDEILTLLQKLPLTKNSRYSPYIPFMDAAQTLERVKVVGKMSITATRYMEELGGTDIIWAHTLRKTQEECGEIDRSKNIFQNKVSKGDLVPHTYKFNTTKSPRFTPIPSHTLSTVFTPWRKKIFSDLAMHSGNYVNDLDFSACHARACTIFISESNGPLLHKSAVHSDLWLEIATKEKGKHEFLSSFPLKLLRKCIKIKSLAMLNGGGLHVDKHIESHLDNQVDEDNVPAAKYLKRLSALLAKLPIVMEFHEHGKYMYFKKSVYLMTSTTPKRLKSHCHKLNSAVMASAETYLMTLFVEFILTYKYPLIPLVLIHDGIVVLSRIHFTKERQEEFNAALTEYISSFINLSIPMEFTIYCSNQPP